MSEAQVADTAAQEQAHQQPAESQPAQTPDNSATKAGRDVFGANSEQSVSESEQSGGDNQPDFQVPDEYKDRGWANKIKSQDDLFKQLDSLDRLAGKKQLGLDDIDPTNQEQVNHVFEKLKPSDIDDYAVPEYLSDSPDAELAKSVLFEAGVPKHAADKAMEALASKLGERDVENFSKEGLEAELKNSFGDKYQEKFQAVAREAREILSPEDAKLVESMPNNVVGLFYRTLDKVLESHGARDGAAPSGSNQSSGMTPDAAKQAIGDVRKELEGLKRRPHKPEERSQLVSRLRELTTIAHGGQQR